jgi:hypothetical protein
MNATSTRLARIFALSLAVLLAGAPVAAVAGPPGRPAL